MPISKPHSSLGATNKKSCSKLAFYLEKENQDLDKLVKDSSSLSQMVNIENRKQLFFSHTETNISTNKVIYSIDNNIKKLGKDDSKYFAPTISFSQLELEHILYLITSRKGVKDVWELSITEFNKYNLWIQEYARLVMNNYAVNFNRQEKGLKSGAGLVYFGKVEHFRRFKGTDEEVKSGLVKTDSVKPGVQSHVHVIVSRKDLSQKMKLTPTTKDRCSDRVLRGNKYRVGFDRMKWTIMNENSFDSFFKYQRKEMEKFENQYLLKNGSTKDKEDLIESIKRKETSKKTNKIYAKNNTSIGAKRRVG